MQEPKGTIGASKAMKHDSSPTRAMQDPKGTAGAGKAMKHDLSQTRAMRDPKGMALADCKQTTPQGIVNKLSKPFANHSRPVKNLSLLSKPKQENQNCEIETKSSVVEDNVHFLRMDKQAVVRHSMRGSASQPGIIPFSVHELFRVTQEMDEYQKFVFSAFEMEAGIASMKEALEITIGEKEEAVVKNKILETELDVMSSKLNTALVDAELLKEELVRMKRRLSDSKAASRNSADSVSYLSRQKEDIVSSKLLKHNDAGSWVQDYALMLSIVKKFHEIVEDMLARVSPLEKLSLLSTLGSPCCPHPTWNTDVESFHALDDGAERVFVVRARGSTGLVLTIASEVFKDSGQSVLHGTLDYLQGLKAVKEDVRTIQIQRPSKGPFFVSPKSIDQLISNLRKWARVLDAASQRRGLDAEGGKSSMLSDNLKRDRLMPAICVICLEEEYNAVFIPC
ncbi:hypothetical protein HPP92_020994 [Vanilla planifolia]|uniref:RING-type E3 ubiquitin transferase n=1 Tax=Vanilla planifolia TaxID=51239 RepID=A0A835UID1_VANPL|nr:hypothetical protein HPP92_020994 [Vanilla planifolia]